LKKKNECFVNFGGHHSAVTRSLFAKWAKIKIKYPEKFLILQRRTKLKIKTKFKSFRGEKEMSLYQQNTKEMQWKIKGKCWRCKNIFWETLIVSFNCNYHNADLFPCKFVRTEFSTLYVSDKLQAENAENWPNKIFWQATWHEISLFFFGSKRKKITNIL